jgi:hypothetical protein
MRWQAVIILLVITFGIVGPPTLSMIVLHDGHTTIGTLDVCHSSTPALSTSGDMPCMSECLFQSLPLNQNAVVELANPRFKPFFISFQDERPPKV